MDGKLINEMPPKDRDMAMVFQSYVLYPHMTVYENMALALKFQKKSKAEINTRVRTVADKLGLTPYLDRRPDRLSGGERQRVAIGRAIVRNPRIFLMDELLSNLDAKLRNQMRAEIIRLHEQLNTTFIYVTHDQTEAMTLGNRIVVMKDGEIQQIGTPHQVFDYPANTFVAGFIGTPPMNLIQGVLKRDEARQARIAVGQYELPLSENLIQDICGRGLAEAGQLIIGFRPEHASVSWEERENYIHASVELAEMLGSEMQIHVDLNGTDVVLRVPILAIPETMREVIPVGTSIYFMVPETYLRFFDSESGISIFNGTERQGQS